MPERIGLEKPRAAKPILQDRPALRIDHRRKLVRIANQDHLHAAERRAVLPVRAQGAVYRFQQVAPHHGDFVDDDRLRRLHHARIAHAVQLGPVD